MTTATPTPGELRVALKGNRLMLCIDGRLGGDGTVGAAKATWYLSHVMGSPDTPADEAAKLLAACWNSNARAAAALGVDPLALAEAGAWAELVETLLWYADAKNAVDYDVRKPGICARARAVLSKLPPPGAAP